MKADTELESDGNWLPSLLRTAGTSETATPEEIMDKVGRVADSAAPLARSWWKWMVLIQGFSVAAPLLWLARRSLGLTPATAALLTLVAVLLLVVSLWWMRWRGMQRTWARARLVVEVMRGQGAAAVCPVLLRRRVLESVPTLKPLLQHQDPALQKPWPEWRDAWIASRIDTQVEYYRNAREKAEKIRRNLTRAATLCMDVMLAFAAAGLVLTFSNRAPQWLRMLGDYRIECILGLTGALLALAIILLQSLRHLQELNRRTAGYARQAAMLDQARERLKEEATPELAVQIVEDTEEQLLGEVVDWYFEAETAEQFFQVRDRAQAKAKHVAPTTSFLLRPVYWAWIIGGAGLFFLARVALGRAPWVVGAAAATLGWLSFTSPTDPEARSKLRAEGQLVDEAGQPWHLDSQRKANGCIIIAHGLHDGARFTAHGAESSWMREMSEALHARLKDREPNIGLVDWATAAAPTNIHRIDPKTTVGKFLGDLAGIPSQAREVGDFLAFRLAQLILEKQIDRDAPLHLIGHSAGGFVVSRAALQLHRMNLAPATMHVTILDTPAPDAELVVEVPKACSSVDFYITSPFVRGLDDAHPPAKVHLKHISPPKSRSLLGAHSYAYEWFTQTIPEAQADETGFGRSPFMKQPNP
jgi:hypothetical protein